MQLKVGLRQTCPVDILFRSSVSLLVVFGDGVSQVKLKGWVQLSPRNRKECPAVSGVGICPKPSGSEGKAGALPLPRADSAEPQPPPLGGGDAGTCLGRSWGAGS